MTAKPDETEPCNSPLVGGTLKSRPANPLPFGLGVLCCPIEQLSHPSRVIGHFVLLGLVPGVVVGLGRDDGGRWQAWPRQISHII